MEKTAENSGKSLKDIAYSRIAGLLIENELKPGEPLVETSLAARLNIGRTPVREALLHLAQEGLVEIFPRRGAFVARISLKDVRELFEIREAIEGIAARLATMKSDPEKLSKFEERFKEADREENKRKKLDLYEEIGEELHEYILAVCDNRRITQIISTYKVLLQRERHHAASIPGRIEAASKDHQAVLAAMIERNPKKAEAAMRRHIAGTAKSILETYPNYY